MPACKVVAIQALAGTQVMANSAAERDAEHHPIKVDTSTYVFRGAPVAWFTSGMK